MPVFKRSTERSAQLARDYESDIRELVDIPPRPAWHAFAACTGLNPDIFFPAKNGTSSEAKAICSGCAVSAECLEFALKSDEQFGIWGGVGITERRKAINAEKSQHESAHDQPQE